LEYEAAWALGAATGVDDLDALTFANFICNEQGFDPISFGATVGAAMEMFEDGHHHNQGDRRHRAQVRQREGVDRSRRTDGKGEGFGAEIGSGSKLLCEKYGHPDLSMSVKGQEFPAYDSRGIQGMGLTYATSNRGACHLRGYTVASEVLGIPEKDRSAGHRRQGRSGQGVPGRDGGGRFGRHLRVHHLRLDARRHRAADRRGVRGRMDVGDAARSGRAHLEHGAPVQPGAGFTGKDDNLPQRLLKDAAKTGPAKGLVNGLETMLPEYYQARGWTPDGVPTNETVQRLVIIGAGPAGIVAAETLKKLDGDAAVTVIGKEAEPPYSRMAIPYFLTGSIGEDGTHLRKTEGHYEKLGIDYSQGTVAAIDTAASKVTLEDGGDVSFDRLLIATGSHPVKPPVEGLNLPGVHHCWTLDDARRIIDLAHEGAHVVLMGAGFIGCIILESLAVRKVQLTVVEAADRMLPRMMNATGAGMMKAWCESHGVAVKTATKVTGIEQSIGDGDDTLAVHLDDGSTLPAHLVVVAAGVHAYTEFLDGSGIDVDQGVLVNDRLQTSAETVYAAGDCAQGPDFSTGGWSVHAIQPTCTEHGRIAALNMSGRDSRYQGSLNMNVLDTLGLITSSFGAWDGVDGGDGAEVVNADAARYMRLEFQGDRLVGALALGRTDHIGCLRGLIQSNVRLGTWKAKLSEDPSRIAEAYVACTKPA
jgi:NADPH-dependent 2,4-dienoyl-CoA reductase/sulfur reductase-like enzyme